MLAANCGGKQLIQVPESAVSFSAQRPFLRGY